ncbi:MAG: methyltransferase [Hyphomicrobium sp.]|uniref:methyltransferase n=1 Tax=Hyphomicrobium sp. TaxID=82 RepID=UPI0035687638
MIGGKWKGEKVFGFVFNEDPTELLSQIANGEKRNLKKEYQFFGTPDELADDLVFEAQIEPFHEILEPSAGQGAIVKAILRVFPKLKVDAYELMPVNQTFLKKISEVNLIGEDFLTADNKKKYDVIIANPPFAANQDIDHIMKMYDLLKVGGRLVSVASKHWQTSTNKKETAFRDWLKKVEYDFQEIPSGKFKESGTNIATVFIVINKKS